MKSKDKRAIAIYIISQMKYNELYTSRQLCNLIQIPLMWHKHLSTREMATYLREQKRKGILEHIVIRGKGYWKKTKNIQYIYAT